MTGEALHTQGCRLLRGVGGSPEAFADVGEISNLAGPNETASPLDATTLESTSREFILGLRDGGEVSLEINYRPTLAQHQAIREDLRNKVRRNWQIKLTDAGTTTISFTAVVTNWGGPQIPVDAVIKVPITLKVSGDVTYT